MLRSLIAVFKDVTVKLASARTCESWSDLGTIAAIGNVRPSWSARKSWTDIVMEAPRRRLLSHSGEHCDIMSIVEECLESAPHGPDNANAYRTPTTSLFTA